MVFSQLMSASILILSMSASALGPASESEEGSDVSAEACLEDCQHRKSLSAFRKSVLEHSKNGPQDPGCPDAGSQLIEGSSKHSGSLLSAETLLKRVARELEPKVEDLKSDRSKCGSCKQINQVTITSVSRPRTPGTDQVCASRGSESVEGDFSDAGSAQRFAKATLDGDNSEGKKIYAACEDPCSFYVYQGQSTRPNGKIRLNMTVRCGQPRGSVFAKYNYSGALVHEWTCEKK